MSFDHFAQLAEQQACPQGTGGRVTSLVSGFVDGCTVWFARNDVYAGEYDAALRNEKDRQRRNELQEKKRKHDDAKNDARRCYMERAQAGALQLPSELNLAPWPPALLHQNWLALAVDFELLTPWYSKDDRPFHVLDNPVRKDRVFGVPFMAAASWKGLLRWAMRMTTGLIGPAPIEDEEMRRQAEATVLHLFGNEKGEKENFHQGALVFYPTWFDRIGFEVINPHSRKTRAGTQPIYYEVVPAGTQGTLRLLYAPLPGDERRGALVPLIDAVDVLLSTYGFSAKRTVGWGTAIVQRWTARRMDEQPIEASTATDFKAKLKNWLNPGEANDD